jgi:tetratricopeptide (TPR) repeat protein
VKLPLAWNPVPAAILRALAVPILVFLMVFPAAANSRAGLAAADLQRLFEAGRYDQVRQAAEAAIAGAPGDALSHYWLARSSIELGSYVTAMRAAEKACQLDPRNSDFQMWLGRAYGREAEMESSFFLARKTRRAFETAVKLDPKNIQARRDLAEYYTEAPWFLGGGKDKARQQVEAIGSVDELQGILALADFYRNTDQDEKARQQYEILIQKHPQKIHFYFEALGFYEHERDALQMARVLEAAKSVAPQDPRLLFYRAVSRLLGGLQLAQAETELKEFLAQYPGRSDSVTQGEARYWLGTIYEQEGNWQAAVEQYRLALQSEPYHKRFRKSLERAEKELRKEKK